MKFLRLTAVVFGLVFFLLLRSHTLAAASAEPASIIYIVSGGIAFVMAKYRKREASAPSVTTLFSSEAARKMLQGIHLTDTAPGLD